MKKMMVVVAAMTLVLSFGPAFADSVKADGASKIDNGITHSDLGSAPNCNEDSAKTNQQKSSAVSNGITVVESREAGAKGSCANKAEKEINSSKPYNGVSVF